MAEANQTRPHISVVVPCYGCESCLLALYDGLVAALTPLTSSFEIVLVDDRSPQADWNVITALAARDPRVKGVRLNRNFGQHMAIAAGLAHAEGDWVSVMDCDLQDPPAELPNLYARAKEGYPVVFARRMQREDRVMKRFNSWAFSKVHGWLGGFKIDASVGNYSLISRQVVLQLRRFTERNRTYGMMVGWLGYRTSFVDVKHGARHSGESTYTLRKQLTHALSTILAQSTRPLYVSAGLGLLFSAGAAGYALYLIGRKLFFDLGVEGWTSVMVSLFFLSGMLMMILGVLGLYLGNIFLDVKHRPGFVVEELTNSAESLAQIPGAQRATSSTPASE